MYLTKNARRKIINFLEKNTTYDVELLLRSKTDSQLNGMYNRISDALRTYPYEIFNHLKNNPTAEPRYSLEELLQMRYNELSDLKRKLKIKGSKRKVVKEESASSKVMQEATSHLEKESTSSLAANIIGNEMSRHSERDFEILTEDEIIMMYGEVLSTKQLNELGIVLDDSLGYSSFKAPEDEEAEERLNLVDQIISVGVAIGGKELGFAELLMMSYDELKTLSNLVLGTIKNREDLKRLIK